MEQYFKSIVEQDRAAVVICNLEHRIIYMNPAAVARYGKDLTGCDLRACHSERSVKAIEQVLAWFRKDTANNLVHTFYNEKENKDVYMVALRDEKNTLVGYYEKFEYRERDDSLLYVMD